MILLYDCVIDNYIDGGAFVTLSAEEIKEMVPPIGLAKKILKLIPTVCVWVCRVVKGGISPPPPPP